MFTFLQSPPPDGGLWTGPKVATQAAERDGITVAQQTGWVWRKRFGFKLQRPRPKTLGPPRQSSSRSGKDALDRRLDELRRAQPERPVELWAEDEARLGLKPILRLAWSLRGRRPTASGRMRSEWLYLDGFVHPASGRNLELIIPRVDTHWMSAALAEFARWADPERSKTIVLLVDNAGWHLARGLVVPTGIVLHPLPSCTPELQPVEALWPLVRESVAHKGFADLDEMEPVLERRCRWLIDHPETVKGAVGFGWAVAMNG